MPNFLPELLINIHAHNILDTPGPPYKLEASDIAKDAVTLSWYEPDDDGGNPITGYWVERYEPDHDKWIRCNKLPIRDTNFRYVWMSIHPSMPLLCVINLFVCILICLKYTFACRVKGLPTRKKYKFRVLAENLAGPGKPSKETDQILIKDPIGRINI